MAIRRILFASVTSLIGIFGSSSIFAFDLPGIPASGSPAFINPVKVDLNTNSGVLKISGRQNFTFDNSQQTFLGTVARYTLLANFDTTGFLSGTVELRGAIKELGIRPNEMLMRADIIDWNLADNATLWGFATDNIVCSPLLLISCTTTESVFVELDAPFSGSFNTPFRTTGMAITTVPVPASAWLFGSAVILLGWVWRRNAA